MEQRASELNQTLRATQEQAQDLLARMGLSNPRGSSQREMEQQQQEQEQQERQQQQQSERGAGAFLNRMFGRGGSGGSSNSVEPSS
eukprot:scaffold233742_cov17-Tisochrysis_lutea.AAC.2